MTLARAVRAWTAPMAQVLRVHDGIRGMVAKSRFHRGDPLMFVPLRYCYFPHASRDPRRLRRWNQSVLFTEMPLWLKRLSPDAPEGCVSLSASVSTEDNRVLTVSLSPVEASLAVSVALQYFWRNIALLKDREGDGRPPLGPPRSHAADLYIKSLPIEEYLSFGLEEPYFSEVEGEMNIHSGIEQIAWNLRDCILSHAPQEEYIFYDAHPSELDDIILAAIYIVRARLLRMTAIAGNHRRDDSVTSVIAPVVEFLNHSSADNSCVACISLPRRGVVVRAARDIYIGEELTLNYRGGGLVGEGSVKKQKELSWRRENSSKAEGEEEDWWESRYLFSTRDA